MTLYKVYTGPTLVGRAAHLLLEAGLRVQTEGTEHVYVEAETPQQVLNALPTWTWRDVHPARGY